MSIVMPSLNQASFLKSSVESVLQQTFLDLELIVMDGGSTDGTLLLLEDIQARAERRFIWQSVRDDGAADAVNKALVLARGDIIGWLNSDDVYAAGAVERAVNYFSHRPNMMMVYGDGEHIDFAGSELGVYPTKTPPLNEDILRESCPICQPTVFFRRKILTEIGYLDSTLSVSFDYDYWIKIWTRYPQQIGFIPKTQAYSRVHSASKTTRQRKAVALESMRVTSRGLAFALPHWFYTWLDEYFEAFPFEGEDADPVDEITMAIHEARKYLRGSDQISFDERLNSDVRLRLFHRDASIQIYSDGWLAPRSVLRVRLSQRPWTRLRLHCRHASPTGEPLYITVGTPLGRNFEVAIAEVGSFSLDFELPAAHKRPMYWSFNIKTEGAFIPSVRNHESADTRSLAFIVDQIELLEQKISVPALAPSSPPVP